MTTTAKLLPNYPNMPSFRRRNKQQQLVSVLLFSALITVVHLPHASSLANSLSSPSTVVKVCQNKDCCQRFQGREFTLVETLQHLVSNHQKDKIQIESSGCLSQCGHGPNLEIIQTSNGEERLYHEVTDVHSAAAVLDLAFHDNNNNNNQAMKMKIHPTLVAAVKVMERAKQASTLAEKETCLTSVIAALDKKTELARGTVQAHAYVLRSQLRLEAGQLEGAREDALLATQLDPAHPTAWRALADVYEASNDIANAVKALSKWAEQNPMFRTKISKELARLEEMQQQRKQI